MRGHQLAEMRAAAGLIQAALADTLGVSQARVSKIEHGEISASGVVRAYVAALGGSVQIRATAAHKPHPAGHRSNGANFFALPPARLGRRRIVHAVR